MINTKSTIRIHTLQTLEFQSNTYRGDNQITRHLGGFAEVAPDELDDESRGGEDAGAVAIEDEAVVGGAVG